MKSSLRILSGNSKAMGMALALLACLVGTNRAYGGSVMYDSALSGAQSDPDIALTMGTATGSSGWFFNGAGLFDSTGWLFSGDTQGLFPAPVDPGQPWTSVENIATLSAWQDLLNQAAGDPELLARLAGPGLTDITLSTAESSAAQLDLTTSQQIPHAAPEPASVRLSGTAATLLAVYVAFVVPRRRAGSLSGPA